jgi:integrase
MAFVSSEWVLEMATRNKPLWRTDAGVKIYGPTTETGKGKYYRIVYAINGVQRERSATTLDKAKQCAVLASKEVVRGGDRRAELNINEFIDAFLDPEKRERVGRKWGKKHTRSQRNLLNRYLRTSFGKAQCSDIDNNFLRSIIKQAPTLSVGEHLSTCLRGWVTWGIQEGWILESRATLLAGLPNEVRKLTGIKKAIESGENDLYVNESEIPTHGDVAAVASAAAMVSGIWWHELMFNLAAYSGLRIGEIIDLDVTSINTLAKTIRVSQHCLEDGGNKERALPKFGKQRNTIFPRVTPSGYELLKKLELRIAEVMAIENPVVLQDGTNRRLLFTNTKGTWICQSSFAKSVRRPAQEIAGWPKKENGKFRWTFHSLRHVFCTYYLSDLKQAAGDVAIAAGHSDAYTTISMYVGASREAIAKLSAAN